MTHVDVVLDGSPTLPPWGHGRARAWWNSLPESLRDPLWPRTLAVLVILALLLGFHQVVREAVRQGEVLRMTTASRAEAVWRCNTLNAQRMRARCLAQLDAPPVSPVDAAAAPPNTALSVADLGR
jgi:hypothetical protein